MANKEQPRIGQFVIGWLGNIEVITKIASYKFAPNDTYIQGTLEPESIGRRLKDMKYIKKYDAWVKTITDDDQKINKYNYDSFCTHFADLRSKK